MKDRRSKGCPNPACGANQKMMKFKADDEFCSKCGTQLSFVCSTSKCYSSIEDQGPKHRICASCEAKKADRKDAILDKGGKALGGLGVVGAVVVGVIKKLPKKL